MIPEDEELNFAISPDDPVPGQIEEDLSLWLPEDLPLRLGARRPHDIGNQDAWIIIGGFVLFIVFVIIGIHYTDCPRSTSSSINAQSSQTVQPASQPSSQPEYFPAGWAYVRVIEPTEMYKDNQTYTIPQDSMFFVSLRMVNGSYLAVAMDGSWDGWVKVTGDERQIPMHPNFAGAKKFIDQIDWNLLASSTRVAAPSREDAQRDLEALRAFEVTAERNDMTLFQKQDQQPDRQGTSDVPEITVQGERAVIPAAPEPEQQEKRVKLPKTKWFAGSEGTKVPSVFPVWSCEIKNRKQTYCNVQDGKGNILFDFYPGEGCKYDGRQVVCGN